MAFLKDKIQMDEYFSKTEYLFYHDILPLMDGTGYLTPKIYFIGTYYIFLYIVQFSFKFFKKVQIMGPDHLLLIILKNSRRLKVSTSLVNGAQNNYRQGC